jgi:hypothetical protein
MGCEGYLIKLFRMFNMVVLSLLLSSCFQSTFVSTPASESTTDNKNPSSDEGSLAECAVGSVTNTPCAIRKSGIAVSQDFGADVEAWTNILGSTTVKADIPNGFYANHKVSFVEPNLTPSNIKLGVSIFGVTGNMATDSCDTPLVFGGATGTSATLATSTTINWTPVAGAQGYIIVDSTTSTFKVVGSSAVGSSSFQVTGLTAATAYKFRVKALSSTGFVDCNTTEVSVTTSSQITPSDLTGLEIWLKPETLAGNTDGGPVNQWDDSSTNARHFASSGATRPLFRANALNSKGGLEFDGVDDTLNWGVDYAADNFTVFYVALPTAAHEIDTETNAVSTQGVTGQYYLSYPVQEGTSSGVGISFGTNGISSYEHGNSYLSPLAVSSASYATPTIVVLSYNNKTPSLYSGTTLVRTGLPSTRPAAFAPRYLGSAAFTSFSGRVYEFISFSRVLTTQERTDMVNYLKTKFGI